MKSLDGEISASISKQESIKLEEKKTLFMGYKINEDSIKLLPYFKAM